MQWWPHCNCQGNVTYNEQNIMLSHLRYAHVLLTSDTAFKNYQTGHVPTTTH
jgi:hypothetical protein